MKNKKKETKNYEPLSHKPMAVSEDGSTLSVVGQVFKRVVLPSVATPKKAEDDLEQAFEEMDALRTQEAE